MKKAHTQPRGYSWVGLTAQGLELKVPILIPNGCYPNALNMSTVSVVYTRAFLHAFLSTAYGADGSRPNLL